MMGTYKRGQFDIIATAVLYPFYMILMSIAAYRAVVQLFSKPHLWERTVRGRSKIAPDQTAVRTYEVGGL